MALPAAAHVAVPLGRTGSATSFGARVFPAPAGMRSGCGRRNHPGLCSRAPGGVPALRRAVICLSPVSPHSARVPITGARMSRTGARLISMRERMEIIRVSVVSIGAPMEISRASMISGDARRPVTHAPVISILPCMETTGVPVSTTHARVPGTGARDFDARTYGNHPTASAHARVPVPAARARDPVSRRSWKRTHAGWPATARGHLHVRRCLSRTRATCVFAGTGMRELRPWTSGRWRPRMRPSTLSGLRTRPPPERPRRRAAPGVSGSGHGRPR